MKKHWNNILSLWPSTALFRIALSALMNAVSAVSCSTSPSKPKPLFDEVYYARVRDFVDLLIDSDYYYRLSGKFLLEDSVS